MVMWRIGTEFPCIRRCDAEYMGQMRRRIKIITPKFVYTHKCIQFGCDGINFAENKSSKRRKGKQFTESEDAEPEKNPYET